MSFLDKFLNVMRLNPDDDDDFYNEDYDYDDDEEEVKPKSSFKKREKEDTFTDDYKEKPVRTSAVQPDLWLHRSVLPRNSRISPVWKYA